MITALKVRFKKLIDLFYGHQFVSLFLLFLFTFILWGFLCDYDKTIIVYSDELRYFDIARSIIDEFGEASALTIAKIIQAYIII